MARVLRAHGVEVIDDDAPPAIKDADATPAEPVIAPPAVRDVDATPAEPTHAEHVAHESSGGVGFDLTDEELERLTAPSAGE